MYVPSYLWAAEAAVARYRKLRQEADNDNARRRRAWENHLRAMAEANGVIDVEAREVPDVLLLTWNGK